MVSNFGKREMPTLFKTGPFLLAIVLTGIDQVPFATGLQFTIKMGFDYSLFANDFRNEVVDFAGCCNLCASEAACVAFVWHPHTSPSANGKPRCYLKNGHGVLTPSQDGIYTGIPDHRPMELGLTWKSLVSEHKHKPGSTQIEVEISKKQPVIIRGFDYNTKDENVFLDVSVDLDGCFKTCSYIDTCVAFVWHPHTSSSAKGTSRCYLKNDYGELSRSNNEIYAGFPDTSPVMSTCPSEWLGPTIKSQKCYKISVEEANHNGANEFCTKEGGEFGTIRSQQEYDLVKRVHKNSDQPRVVVDGYKNEDGNWYWGRGAGSEVIDELLLSILWANPERCESLEDSPRKIRSSLCTYLFLQTPRGTSKNNSGKFWAYGLTPKRVLCQIKLEQRRKIKTLTA